MDEQLLETLKALSDASRLRIVGLLAVRPYAVEELAAAVGLSPATVVHHLKRLKAAGLVTAKDVRPYVEYSLAIDRLHEVGRRFGELRRASEPSVTLPGPDGEDLPAYDAKVLRSYLEGGRLARIPAQEKKRLVVVRWLVDRIFTDERELPETTLNERLAAYHEDVALLRRSMIAHRLVTRAAGQYRRAAPVPAPAPAPVA